MGILNVTPDSFSDGGYHFAVDAALSRAQAMLVEGADIIDVGAESTRPGSQPVPADEQIRRAIPVVRAMCEAHPKAIISIDTRSAGVAHEAILAGAAMINDVSAMRDDPAIMELAAGSGVYVVLMHRRGSSPDMQKDGGPHYDNVIAEVAEFLAERRDAAVNGGVHQSRIILDPGIGFGKRAGHNWTILARLDRIIELGQPVLIGVSRKRFLGGLPGLENPKARDAASLGCAVWAAISGACILRVHDVASTVQSIRAIEAIRRAAP